MSNEPKDNRWADLTIEEIEQIKDPKKRREYQKQVRQYYIKIINPLTNLIGKKFVFSKPDKELTCKIIKNEYLKYFHDQNLTNEEIAQMIVENRTNKGKVK